MNKIKTILMTAMLALGLAGCGSNGSSTSPAHVHTYDEGVITTPATCTEAGVKTFTCECGDTYTEEVAVDPTNHVNTKSNHAVATLDTPAYDEVVCEDCTTVLSVENEDAWTSRSIIQVFADQVFEDSSNSVRGATLEDGTEVRYTAANFGNSLGTPAEAIELVTSVIFDDLEGLDVYQGVTDDGDGGYYALYSYESDYTFLAVEVDSYLSSTNTIIQVMSYVVEAA